MPNAVAKLDIGSSSTYTIHAGSWLVEYNNERQ
jgi:hypothetical protein